MSPSSAVTAEAAARVSGQPPLDTGRTWRRPHARQAGRWTNDQAGV